MVDSDDLPLNVSRETLQQHKILKVMGKKLVRKVLEMLRKLATGKDEDDADGNTENDDSAITESKELYIKFWEEFGKSIKMGVIEDAANRSKLAKLLRYKTSTSKGKYRSLEEYVANMADWQNDIYFISGESVNAVEKSPFMEVAARKNVEVIYLVDPIDEYAFQAMSEFDGHKLQSLTKEGAKFQDEDEEVTRKRAKHYKELYKPLTKYLKKLLGTKVSKVLVSQRVEKSPAIIVTAQYGNTANMERIMRAQTFASSENVKSMAASKTLELNPRHPVVVELNNKVVSDPESQMTADLGYLMFDTALLASGFLQDDVDAYSERMVRVLAKNLNVDSLSLVEEVEIDDVDESSDAGTGDEF